MSFWDTFTLGYVYFLGYIFKMPLLETLTFVEEAGLSHCVGFLAIYLFPYLSNVIINKDETDLITDCQNIALMSRFSHLTTPCPT